MCKKHNHTLPSHRFQIKKKFRTFWEDREVDHLKIICLTIPTDKLIVPPPYWRDILEDTTAMRQLKGKPKKESNRDKKERKQAMMEARQQITTVVLPTIAVLVVIIVVLVYVATRPHTIE